LAFKTKIVTTEKFTKKIRIKIANVIEDRIESGKNALDLKFSLSN